MYQSVCLSVCLSVSLFFSPSLPLSQNEKKKQTNKHKSSLPPPPPLPLSLSLKENKHKTVKPRYSYRSIGRPQGPIISIRHGIASVSIPMKNPFAALPPSVGRLHVSRVLPLLVFPGGFRLRCQLDSCHQRCIAQHCRHHSRSAARQG